MLLQQRHHTQVALHVPMQSPCSVSLVNSLPPTCTGAEVVLQVMGFGAGAKRCAKMKF